MTRHLVRTPDHQISLKVVQEPIVERTEVLCCASDVGVFVAGHGTVKFGSEVCRRREAIFLQIDQSTAQQAGEKGALGLP
jgi:hypothetical protein